VIKTASDILWIILGYMYLVVLAAILTYYYKKGDGLLKTKKGETE